MLQPSPAQAFSLRNGWIKMVRPCAKAMASQKDSFELAGDGELIVFLGEAAAVFVYELADGDAADGRWG